MIFIDNGLSPDEPYSMTAGINRCMFWLPADFPNCNFQLKLIRIELLTYTANLRLKESFESWQKCSSLRDGMISPDCFLRHGIANEQAIYLMRRVADELISLLYCLSEWEIENTYPSKIEIDRIGKLLEAIEGKIDFKLTSLFKCHQLMLKTLNEISNAFKHSFIHSDSLNIIGTDEACVHALDDGKAKSAPKLHLVSLATLVQDFNVFYNVALDWLKDFSKRHQPTTPSPVRQSS